MFDDHFEAVLADTDQGREIHYRIRYEVYCLDMNWENAVEFPDRMERDSFDSYSAHFLVRKKRGGTWVAAMRLVIGPVLSLPISSFSKIDYERLPEGAKALSAEISRLSVISKYRRRKDTAAQDWDWDDSFLNRAGRTNESWLMLGLLRAATQFSRDNGIGYWVFMLTEALARIVRASGLKIEAVGSSSEHRGIRIPHLFDVQTGASEMAAKAPDVARSWEMPSAYRLFSELKEDSRSAQRLQTTAAH